MIDRNDETHEGCDTGCTEYQALSRRQFVGAAAATGATAFFPSWLPKVVLAQSSASTRDIIVSIFMRGGTDGLSLCVPFADANYYASRSTIAIPRPDSTAANKGIALDNFFAFPQAMSGLMPAYTAQDLLVVHATGSLNNSRSHFDAQRYMEVGKPADPALVTGWLGRHLASMPPVRTAAPLRALGIANGLQKTLVGGPRTLPIADPTNSTIGGSSTTLASRLALL
ncbi:MAG TPA: twin-arginine translocation signal domain-containing protein, partial [Gemmatimonadaceae bacterium]|nr:twin-arginine translocation signal domain-containing protein [Gemmatimonadaceae bacterium]